MKLRDLRIMVLVLVLAVSACSKPKTESELYRDIEVALDEQQYQKAEVLIKSYLSENPNADRIRTSLGRLHTERGVYSEAVFQFEKALPAVTSELHIERLLESYYFTDASNDAIAYFSKHVTDEPRLNLANVLIAILQVRNGEQADDSRLRKLASLSPTGEKQQSLHRLVNATLALKQTNDVFEYIEVLQSLANTEHFKQSWLIHSLLASAALNAGEYRTAATSFEAFTQIRPRYFQTRLFLADALAKAGDLTSAERYAKDILGTFPDQPLANFIMGMVELERSQLDFAKAYFEKALSAGYKTKQNYLLAGSINFQLGNFEQAIFQLERGIEGNQNVAVFENMLLFAKSKTNDSEQIVLSLSEAELSSMGDIRTVKNLVESFRSMGNQKGIQTLFDNVSFAQSMDKRAEYEYELMRNQLGLAPPTKIISNLEKLLSADDVSSNGLLTQNIRTKMVILDTLYETNQAPKALSKAKAWYDEAPDIVQNRLLYADALIINQQASQAIELLLTESQTSQNAYVFRTLAKAYNAINDKPKALEAAKQALSLSQYDLILLRQYAYMVLSNEAPSGRDAWLDQLYTQVNTRESETILVSMYYSMLQQYSIAAEVLEQYATPERASALYAYTLAQTYLQLDQHEQAKQSLKVAARAPWMPYETIMPIAGTLRQLGAFDDAISMLKKQANNYTQATEFKAAIASLLAESGKEADAIDYLQGLRESNTSLSTIHSDLLMRTGKLKEGVETLQQAYAIKHDRVTGIKLARTLAQLNESEAAQNVLDDVLARHPGDIDTMHVLASMSSDSDAIKIYEDILRNRPEHANTLNNLAWTLYEVGQLEKALPLIQKALSIAPNNPAYQDTLQNIEKALGT